MVDTCTVVGGCARIKEIWRVVAVLVPRGVNIEGGLSEKYDGEYAKSV